jgi:hypothetical protein
MIMEKVDELLCKMKEVGGGLAEVKGQLEFLSQTPAQRLKKQHFNFKEVCRITDRCEKTLRKRIKSGELKAGKLGRKLIFRAQDVYDFIERSFKK